MSEFYNYQDKLLQETKVNLASTAVYKTFTRRKAICIHII